LYPSPPNGWRQELMITFADYLRLICIAMVGLSRFLEEVHYKFLNELL